MSLSRSLNTLFYSFMKDDLKTNFLTSTEISGAIEHLIKNAERFIYLVSPYIDINELLKKRLDEKASQIPVVIIYGKKKKHELESAFQNAENYQLFFNKNLHGKLYLSDSEAIITSLNLYEYSQVNNIEYGIRVEKNADPTLYESMLREVKFLQSISESTKKEICNKNETEEQPIFTMGNLHGELSNINFKFPHVPGRFDEKYKAICDYARSIHTFSPEELYSDESAILRRTEVSKELYNKIKEHFIQESKK